MFKRMILSVVVATAFVCIGFMPALQSSSQAQETVITAEEEGGDHNWYKWVVKGHTPAGADIDATLYKDKETGELFVEEEEHPLEIPDSFRHVKTQKADFIAEVEGKESAYEIYNTPKDNEVFVVVKLNGTRAAYFYMDTKTSKKYDARGSYDPDENFEQSKPEREESKSFEHCYEDYFPSLRDKE